MSRVEKERSGKRAPQTKILSKSVTLCVTERSDYSEPVAPANLHLQRSWTRMDSPEFSFDWQEASKAAADAMNLLHMHPSRTGLESRPPRAALTPSAITFRATREDDRLSILLLVDDPADALMAYAGRNRTARARDAVAEVAGEVVGYCGLEMGSKGEISAFSVTDPFDRRGGAIGTAIVHRLESWRRELGAGLPDHMSWHANADGHPIGGLSPDQVRGRNAA